MPDFSVESDGEKVASALSELGRARLTTIIFVVITTMVGRMLLDTHLSPLTKKIYAVFFIIELLAAVVWACSAVKLQKQRR